MIIMRSQPARSIALNELYGASQVATVIEGGYPFVTIAIDVPGREFPFFVTWYYPDPMDQGELRRRIMAPIKAMLNAAYGPLREEGRLWQLDDFLRMRGAF